MECVGSSDDCFEFEEGPRPLYKMEMNAVRKAEKSKEMNVLHPRDIIICCRATHWWRI